MGYCNRQYRCYNASAMRSIIFNRSNIGYALMALAVFLGVFLRLYGLSGSGLFFYDEALYLNHSLPAFELFERLPVSGADAGKAFWYYLHWPLNFTKPVWILIIDLRYFITHWNDWDFSKYIACFFGVLTLPLAFVFARRFFHSRMVACLSVAILALLPAHVFYSRVGLQETLSTFFVLAGFYFYFFTKDFSKRTVFAGLLFSMAYLSNYRLIILPGLIVTTELWFGLMGKDGIRWRHLVWTCLTFLIVLVLVGSMMGGTQMRYTFAWIFHQQDMTAGKRLWSEILAYPYYLFRLENWIFACSFFASVYFLIKRNWKFSWPLLIVCLQMALFTLASDRGARYMAIVIPFMAMSSAALICAVYDGMSSKGRKAAVLVLTGVMFLGMAFRSLSLASDVSAYRPSVEYLLARKGDVRFLSTQEIIQRLYLQERGNVQPAPVDPLLFLQFYAKGYRYLVIDPQAYIAYTGNDFKWGLPLESYLGFIDQHAQPIKTFEHFNRAVMERVVFEHSDNLFQSIRFLDSPDIKRMSSLRIYDLSVVVPAVSAVMERYKSRAPGAGRN